MHHSLNGKMTSYSVLTVFIYFIQGNLAITYLYAKEEAKYFDSGPQYQEGKDYLNSQDIYWLITSTVEGHNVIVEVENSYIESKKQCSADYLKFYDGMYTTSVSLGKYCGSDTPRLRSQGERLLVRFKTDHSDTEKGFRIKYYSSEDPYAQLLHYVGITLAIIITVFCLCTIRQMFFTKKKKCNCCCRNKTSVQRMRARPTRERNQVEVWTATIALQRPSPNETSGRTMGQSPPVVQPPPYTPRDAVLESYRVAEEIDPDQPPCSPPPAYVEVEEGSDHPNYIHVNTS